MHKHLSQVKIINITINNYQFIFKEIISNNHYSQTPLINTDTEGAIRKGPY